MCKLNADDKMYGEFTGYKRVIIHKGRFISPATGVVYKKGMTLPNLSKKKIPPRSVYGASGFRCVSDLVMENGYCFEYLMVGRTAVYVLKEDAMRSKCCSESIIKMTIAGDMIRGQYGCCQVVAGKRIVKMRKLPSTSSHIELDIAEYMILDTEIDNFDTELNAKVSP